MTGIQEIQAQADTLESLCPELTKKITSENEYQKTSALLKEVLQQETTSNIVSELLSQRIKEYERTYLEFETASETPKTVVVLKALMSKHNLDTTSFKNEIGDKSAVSRILNEKRPMTLNHMKALSERFGISMASFF